MLTKQEIVQRLIEIYENLLAQDDIDIDMCYAYGVQQGICTAMARNLARNSSEMRDNYNTMTDLINEYADYGKHWGPTPEHGDIQSALEYRLNILYEINERINTDELNRLNSETLRMLNVSA